MTLSRLRFGYKLVITLFLINILLGLLFARIQVYYAIEMQDAEAGISLADFRLFFQGDPTTCRLQTVLMSTDHGKYVSPDEIAEIEDWIAEGAPRDLFESDIAPIFAAKCISCHGPGGENANLPLTNVDQVLRYTQFTNTGISYDRLAANSYLHLTALTCFTALLAGLFYLTRYRGVWKQLAMALAFIMIFVNVLSWWSAKQSLLFVHVIIASGLVLAAMIVVMVLLTLVDIWFLPEAKEEQP